MPRIANPVRAVRLRLAPPPHILRRPIQAHVGRMKAAARAVYRAIYPSSDAPESGYFVPPTLIEIDRLSELPREVFGPVLHVLRWK